jgi:glycosyltransferase Alg8
LRANARAIALGPRRVGDFTWWCLIDQRISIWTALAGPVVASIFVLGKSAVFLYIYLLWVAITRLVQASMLLTARPRLSGLYPPLIYFDKVNGALIKSYLLFRLDRQRPTRRSIASGVPLSPSRGRLQPLFSTYLHLLALGALVAVVALAIDLLSPPELAAGGRF